MSALLLADLPVRGVPLRMKQLTAVPPKLKTIVVAARIASVATVAKTEPAHAKTASVPIAVNPPSPPVVAAMTASAAAVAKTEPAPAKTASAAVAVKNSA